MAPAILPRAPLGSSLSVAICGAGIGGLAAAVGLAQRGFSQVTIYESAPEIAEVGAGIQVAPNFCRVLDGFGILEELKKQAVRLERNSVRRYANNKELGRTSFASLEERFGFPTFVVHRGDLHKALLNKAVELGTTLRTNSFVEDVNFEDASVKIKGQGWKKHDVLIAADGIKSQIRGKMMARRGEVDETIDTGEAAYRVILNRSQMENDPELKQLIDDPVAIRWMGPDAHIVSYPIKAHKAYNIVTTHITGAEDIPEDWTNKASKATMQARFSNYAPIVTKLFALAPSDELVEWKLRIHLPLTSWIDNRVALLGDSAHATLPHIAQGAAMAGEDGAVIAAVLSKITDKKDVNKALLSYERLRKTRADWAVEQARITGHNLHVPDGPEQVARDEMIAKASQGVKSTSNPDKWGDKDVQARLYGLDVVAQAQQEAARL